MKLAREFEIERVVSKDQTRPHLCNCYLDVDKKRLVATDGHCMAIVPISGLGESPGPCSTDETGLVATAAIKTARKNTPKSLGDVVLSANGQHVFIDGSTMPRPKDVQFPPYEQVMPSYRKGEPDTITIGLNAELLATLAKAIGVDNGVIALTFPVPSREDAGDGRINSDLGHRDMLNPYVIEGKDGALGILMPARV